MAKLYFRYGTMNSSKSAQLLMVRHNYIEAGKNVLIVASSIDNRAGGAIYSRALDETVYPDVPIYTNTDLESTMYERLDQEKIACILVDEAQFLRGQDVKVLWRLTKEKDVPVICYGLRTDFVGNLFPGSKALFSLADTIEEIKTVCKYCNQKSIFNMRVDEDENPIFHGDSVKIGFGYVPVCAHCYLELKKTCENIL